jgi:hypothetical protein
MATLTRGEQKALALHRAVAARLRADPSLVSLASARLRWLRSQHPAGVAYYEEWERLLSGPLHILLDVMASQSERACALRQESPFVDLVDQKERARIYRAVSDQCDRTPVS